MTDLNNKVDLKAELKAKTDKLVSQDKELFANLSKEGITQKKKERAKQFRADNQELLHDNKLSREAEEIHEYEKMFDQREKKNVSRNDIKDSYIDRSLSTLTSVNNPGGISEVIASDTEGDAQLIATENRVWVRMGGVLGGGGIRHRHYVSLMNGNDKLFSSDIIVRDEYVPEKDKKDERIRDVKILDVQNDKIVIAIKKSGKFEVKEFDTKNNKLLNSYHLNYAKLEALKRKKLGLDFSRDETTLEYDRKNIAEVLRKKYTSCNIIEVEKGMYVALGINKNGGRYTGVDCFLLKDGRRDFTKTTIDISQIDQYHFTGSYPEIESNIKINSVESGNDNLSIDAEFLMKEGSYFQQDYHYRNPRIMGRNNFKLSLDKN